MEHLPVLNPRDADATATGIGGWTHEETTEVINGTWPSGTNDVSERLAHLDLDLSDKPWTRTAATSLALRKDTQCLQMGV